MPKIIDERVGRQPMDIAGALARGVAHDYKVPVFPCAAATKRPLIEAWPTEATTDPKQIAAWWRQWPDALVGVPTGSRSGLLAVDCDPRGRAWFQANKGRLGQYRLHQTRRGKHLLYQYPSSGEVRNSTSQVAPGVDVRGEGGYVIWWAAHGMTAMGSAGALPTWLADLLVKRKIRRLNGHAALADPDWEAERPRVIQALAQLDPDLSHDEWRDVAAAISQASDSTMDGEDIFVCFSRGDYWKHRSIKFRSTTEESVRKKYRSFKNDKERNVTLATLYQMAKDSGGYVPKGRPKANGKEPAFEAKKLLGVRFDTLEGIQHKKIRDKPCWIGEWLYPGAWLVVGRPKIGKSWLLMQMLVQMARGKRFLGFETRLQEADRILAVFAEDDDARLKSRADEFGTVPGSITAINRENFLRLAQRYAQGGDFPAWLDAYLTANPQYRIIVLDTEEVTRFVWKSKELPAERSQRLTSVDYAQTSTFDQIALRHGCAILLVNHSSKLPIKNGAGSVDIHEIINRTNTALAGASGSIAMMDLPEADRLDPTEKRRLLGVRGRDVEEEVLAVLNRPNGVRYINEGAYHVVEQTLAEQELLTELRTWCENGDIAEGEFVSATELAKALHKHAVSVRKAIAKMVKEGRTTWNGYRIVTRMGRTGGIRLEKR